LSFKNFKHLFGKYIDFKSGKSVGEMIVSDTVRDAYQKMNQYFQFMGESLLVSELLSEQRQGVENNLAKF